MGSGAGSPDWQVLETLSTARVRRCFLKACTDGIVFNKHPRRSEKPVVDSRAENFRRDMQHAYDGTKVCSVAALLKHARTFQEAMTRGE